MLLKCHFQNIIFWKSKVDEHKRIANAMRLSMSKTFILRKFYSLINDHCLSWRCWTNCNETSSKHFRGGVRFIFSKTHSRWFLKWYNSFLYNIGPTHLILLHVKPRFYAKPRPLARFIWNAEISVSVAIHCYECLF